MEADYRVRTHIRKCLEKSYARSQHPNIAFQVAFCYQIGFGVKSDESQRDIWLERSNRLLNDLEDEKKAASTRRSVKNGKVRKLLSEGFLDNFDLVYGYRIWGPKK